MTIMLNTATQSAAASAAATAGATTATPVQNADTQPAQTPQAGGVQRFAAWLGDQAQAAALAVQAPAGVPADSATDDAAAPASAAAPAASDDAGDDAPAAAAPQDGALLAAMAMPLMPLSAAQVAQAVQAAQPSGAQPGADDSKPAAAATPTAAVQATAMQVTAMPAAGAPAAATSTAAATPDRAPADADGAALRPERRAAAAERGLTLPQAPVAPAAAPARAEQAPADAVPTARFAAHVQADSGSGTSAGADRGSEHAGAGNGAPAGPADRAALAGAAAVPLAADAQAADTVKLAGPPTAWRQSLQEALGERLNVQVGKNMEQAVIRLEPPQLGRIDIAIRHSAGTLEVNISATNGEVLRQLQTVSENLRSDLSQRQFTEVAVTVAPAQKNSAAPFGDPQQGRGRQQGREQEENQPGRALAEASNNASVFTLGGRD
jgi:flagellar hook-length control protein FliK